MPSMQASVILMTLVLLQFSIASPLPMPEPATHSADCGTAPALPTSALPTTNSAYTYQYTGIGRGIQNYTCTAVGAIPVSIGAIATLYNATAIAHTSVTTLNTIPGLAVNTPATAAGYVLPAPYQYLPKLGNHFFGADGTPIFVLSEVNKILYGLKNASTPAPTDAPVGPAGTGAVAWLDLVAKTGYPTVGLKQVYRVETAGGNPPATCATVGTIVVQYAAEYWFYD